MECADQAGKLFKTPGKLSHEILVSQAEGCGFIPELRSQCLTYLKKSLTPQQTLIARKAIDSS